MHRPAALALTFALLSSTAVRAEEQTITYASGASALDPGALRALDEIALAMKARPDDRLVVEGHADNRGSAEANTAVSTTRVERVVAALVQRGVNRDRIDVVIVGSTQPIASNDTAAGRAKNRRAVLRVVDAPVAAPVVPVAVVEPPSVEPAPAPVVEPVVEPALDEPSPVVVEAAPVEDPVEPAPVAVAASGNDWWKYVPAAVGVAAGVGSVVSFVDFAGLTARYAEGEEELARADLKPDVRARREASNAAMADAMGVDVGIGIGLGVVAVAGVATTIYLLTAGE